MKAKRVELTREAISVLTDMIMLDITSTCEPVMFEHEKGYRTQDIAYRIYRTLLSYMEATK